MENKTPTEKRRALARRKNVALGWGLIQIHAIIMAARARPER
jgi:hypothetical protein